MDIEQEGDSVSTAVSKDSGLTGNEEPMSLVEKFGLEAQGATTDDANEESEISVVSGANAPSLNSSKKKKKKNKKRRNKNNNRPRDPSVNNNNNHNNNNSSNNCASDNDGHGHITTNKLASNETLHHTKDEDDDGKPLVVTTYVCSSSELDKVRRLVDENGNPATSFPTSTVATSLPIVCGKQSDADTNATVNQDEEGAEIEKEKERGSTPVQSQSLILENSAQIHEKETAEKTEQVEPGTEPKLETKTKESSTVPAETEKMQDGQETKLPTETEAEVEQDMDDVEGPNQVRCKSSMNVIFKVGAAVFENPPQSLTSVDQTSSSLKQSTSPPTETLDDAELENDPTQFYPSASASDEPIIKYDANQKSLGELWMADTVPENNEDQTPTLFLVSSTPKDEEEPQAQSEYRAEPEERGENRLINTEDIILNENLVNNNYVQQHNLPELEQLKLSSNITKNITRTPAPADDGNVIDNNKPQTEPESETVQKEDKDENDDDEGHPLINELSADHLSQYKVPDVPNPSVENPNGLVNMNVQPPLLHPHSLARLALLKRENPELVTFAQSAVDKVINSAQEYMNSQVVEGIDTETDAGAGVTEEGEIEPIVESPSEALANQNQNLSKNSILFHSETECDEPDQTVELESSKETKNAIETKLEAQEIKHEENFEEKPSTLLYQDLFEMENDNDADDDEQEEIVKNNLELQEKAQREENLEELNLLDEDGEEEMQENSESVTINVPTEENCAIKFQHFTNLTFGLNVAKCESKSHCEDDDESSSRPAVDQGLTEPSSGVEDEPSLTDEEINNHHTTIEKSQSKEKVEENENETTCREIEEKAETSTDDCDYETAEDVSLTQHEDLPSFSIDGSSVEVDVSYDTLAQAEDLNLSNPEGSTAMDETHEQVQHLDLNESKFSSSPEFKSAGETLYENETSAGSGSGFVDAEDNILDVDSISNIIEKLKECDSFILPDETISNNNNSIQDTQIAQEIRIVLSANKSTFANISASVSSSRSVSSMGSTDDDIIKLPKVPNPSVENHHLAHLSVPPPQINANTFARLVPRPNTIETRDFGIESQQQLELESKVSRKSTSQRGSSPKLSPSVSITSTGAGSGSGRTRISLPNVPEEETFEDATTDSVTNETASEKTITFNSEREEGEDEEEEETEVELELEEEEDYDLNNMDVGEVVKMTKKGATGGGVGGMEVEMMEQIRLSGNPEMLISPNPNAKEQDETNQNWVIDPHVIEDALTESEMGEPDRKARSSLIKNLWNCFGKRGRDKSANRESSTVMGHADENPRPKFRSLSRRK